MTPRPLLVVPRTTNLAQAFDEDAPSIRVSERALRTGLIVLAPRETSPAALMVSCQMWPFVLRSMGVVRVAVVLSVKTYMLAEPLLRTCTRWMKAHKLIVGYFHEGHLESDQIRAWFEHRRARRRLTTDAMMKLSERYIERGDVRGAYHAVELAERLGS
jgi:hypothetical protein